jgi:hypothetical protein
VVIGQEGAPVTPRRRMVAGAPIGLPQPHVCKYANGGEPYCDHHGENHRHICRKGGYIEKSLG